MTVTKVNGFDAPYRSQTFQNQANKIEECSGLLTMNGSVTTNESHVLIPPFDFIQDGLIVSESAIRSIAAPSKQGPYFLTVSAGTPSQTDDLSFQFPHTPTDISATQIILSYWDGLEWHKPQMVSIKEVNEETNQEHIDYGLVGVSSGLTTTLVSPNYVTGAGVITDREGLCQRLQNSVIFPVLSEDPDFDRVDRIVYSRAQDSINRIGVRKFVLGGSYDTGVTLVHPTTCMDSSKVHSAIQTLIGSDNAAHILVAEGHDATYSIAYTKYSSNRTVQSVAKTTLIAAADSGSFASCLDTSNNIHVIFTNNGNLYWAKFSASGIPIVTPKLVHDHSYAAISNPAAAYSAELDAIFIVTQIPIAPSNNKIYFQSIANSNISLSIIKAPTQLTLISGNLINPSICISDDLELYIVAEDLTANRICFAKYDDNATVVISPMIISDNTTYISHGTLVNGAKSPKVFVSNNKSVFVTFLQNKGSSLYGMTVWNDGVATMADFFNPSENLTAYHAVMDDVLNGLHFIVHTGTDIRYLKLEGTSVQLTAVLASINAQSIHTVRDVYGSMLHTWCGATTAGFSVFASSITLRWIGAQNVPGTPNPVTLSAGQLLVSSSLVTPITGDKITTSGSLNALNNLTDAVITSAELISLNSTDDYWKLTLSSSFDASEISPPSVIVGEFKEPNGNSCSFVKTNSELTSKAFRQDVLASDILLARLSLPGPVILNYNNAGTGPTPAKTDRLIPYANGVTFDWSAATAGALTITGTLSILDLVNSFSYNLVAGTYAMDDGDVLYVTLDLANSTPTPLVTPVATLPFAEPIQVLGVIKQGNFVPHALLTSLDIEELEPGEVVTTGHDLPDLIRARLGIISDTQFQPYDQADIILFEDNYPKAISRLDASIYDIQNDYNQEEIFNVVTPITQYTSSVMTWDPDNTKYDILVFVNGKKLGQDPTGGSTKDFFKFDVNIIKFNFTIPAQAELAIFKIRKGGGSAGFLVGKDEGVVITPYAKYINFIGGGVVASNGGAAQINVMIPGGPAYGLGTVKTYYNISGATIPANSAVAFDDLGNIVLADANIVTLSDFVGIVKADITNANYGEVYKLGDCPDVIISLGAVPGEFVYLGVIPGTLSLIPPSGITDTIIIVGRAEPKAGTLPDGSAPSLFLNPQLISGV